MSAESRSASSSSSSSHGLMWVVVVMLVALPLLYLLSVPPLFRWSLTSDFPPMDLVGPYSEPYGWLVEHTPLREPLIQYAGWWINSTPAVRTGYKPPSPPSPTPAP